ncbi:GLPGLI family protein [Flavobacteriaceae bacterium M23B6Z8]
MKNILLIFILGISITGFSQQITVNYERRANIENQIKNLKNEEEKQFAINMLSEPVPFTLIVKDGKSLYYSKPIINKTKNEIKINGKEIKTLNVGKTDGGLYKNYETKEYLKENDLLGKKFLIKDSLRKIEWQLSSEQKKIGDYKVFKAMAVVDDEQITAWYTEDIPIPDGPDNYYGLPGLILEVENEALSFHALTISFEPIQIEIKKPNKGKEITLAEYLKIRDEKIEELKSGNGNVLKFGG